MRITQTFQCVTLAVLLVFLSACAPNTPPPTHPDLSIASDALETSAVSESSSASVESPSASASSSAGHPVAPGDAAHWQKLAYATAVDNLQSGEYNLASLSLIKPGQADMVLRLFYTHRQNSGKYWVTVWQLPSSGDAIMHYSGNQTYVVISDNTGLPYVREDAESGYDYFIYEQGAERLYYEYRRGENQPDTILLPDGRTLEHEGDYYSLLVSYDEARLSGGLSLETTPALETDFDRAQRIHRFLFPEFADDAFENIPEWVETAWVNMELELANSHVHDYMMPSIYPPVLTIMEPPLPNDLPMLEYGWLFSNTYWQNALGLWSLGEGGDSGWAFYKDADGKPIFCYGSYDNAFWYSVSDDGLQFLFADLGSYFANKTSAITDGIYMDFDTYEEQRDWREGQRKTALSRLGYAGELAPLKSWEINLPECSSTEAYKQAFIGALLDWSHEYQN